MPVDMRAVIRGALDLEAPQFSFEAICSRAGEQERRGRRRDATMAAAGLILALVTAVVGAHAPLSTNVGTTVATPSPYPVPLYT